MEKETLEEAAEFWDAKQSILEFEKSHSSTDRPFAKAFITGAEWQAERMYSEEEVKSFLDRYRSQFRMDKNIDVKQSDFIQWFEQFKKI